MNRSSVREHEYLTMPNHNSSQLAEISATTEQLKLSLVCYDNYETQLPLVISWVVLFTRITRMQVVMHKQNNSNYPQRKVCFIMVEGIQSMTSLLRHSHWYLQFCIRKDYNQRADKSRERWFKAWHISDVYDALLSDCSRGPKMPPLQTNHKPI